MSSYTYKEIIQQAKTCYNNVKNNHSLGMSKKWGYYFSKTLLNPKKDITKITIADSSKQEGDYISRQIPKKDYLDCSKRLVAYVEKNHKYPNYINWNGKKISPELWCYVSAKALIYLHKEKTYHPSVNVNSKIFKKPVETTNEVYNYFAKVFGKISSIDEALGKIAGHKYGYYYDDKYSNHEAINRMKNRQGVNCTDSCQVFYNIMLQLIELDKYKKVECLHVKCKGGDGHVRLRITLNDGTRIYRDPAAVLDSGNITHNWCLNGTLIAINPSWFMNNLNR